MMVKVFLVTAVLIALCILGLGFNIFFRKDGKFPETEVSSNKEMKKLGIRCAKEEELRIWGRKKGKERPTCSDIGCSDCSGCNITNKKNETEQ